MGVMSRIHGVRWALARECLAGVAVAAVLVLAVPAEAAPVSPWRVVASPNQGTKGSELYGVSAVGPEHAWAIGEGSGAALIERWNGTAWSIVHPAALRATDRLEHLVTPGVGNIVVSGVAASGSPLVLHFDGSAWTRTVLTMPPGADVVQSVDATSATDVWAAAQGSAGDTLEHWTSIGWRQSIPVVTGSICVGIHIQELYVINDSDVWARICQGKLMRWNGSQVVVEPGPQASPGSASVYNGIGASSASNVWVVGFWVNDVFSPSEGPLAGYFDGATWTSPQPPSYALWHGFNAVAAASPASVWAVGLRWVTDSSGHHVVGQDNLLDYWNGHRWAEYGGPNPTAGDSELLGASPVPHSKTFWAVGETGNFEDIGGNTIILHCCS